MTVKKRLIVLCVCGIVLGVVVMASCLGYFAWVGDEAMQPRAGRMNWYIWFMSAVTMFGSIFGLIGATELKDK